MVFIGDVPISDSPLLLAPMEDVSDPPFRLICKALGADLMYSEFISVEGLIRDAIKSRVKLEFSEIERPIGIQIFGGDEEPLAMAAQIVETTKPDFVDINFGCPVKKVTCKGAGAAVLKDVDKMVSLAESVVKATKLPVTVKTRLGWNESMINIEEVAERLQDIGIKALTIHGRTREQMYKGEADWTLIGKVKNNTRIKIPIFGNGDINSPEKAKLYLERYGVDGIMIGRASIGHPWIFREIKHYLKTGEHLPPPTVTERVQIAKLHLQNSMNWKGERLGIVEMRRHYTNYFRGFENIKTYRSKLVTEDNPATLFAILDEIEAVYNLVSV